MPLLHNLLPSAPRITSGRIGRPHGFRGASDPNFSNVVFLTGWETTSTTTINEESNSAKVLNLRDSTDLQTNPRFGTHCRRIASPRWASLEDSPDWHFGSEPFTIETWHRFITTPSGFCPIIGQWDAGLNQRGWQIQYSTTGTLRVNLSSTGSTFTTVADYTWSPPTDGTWVFLSFDYDGTAYRTYIDGVMVAKTVASLTLFDSNQPLIIGNGTTSGGLIGAADAAFDETRITKGVARYASDDGHEVPTAAFPRS